MKCKNCNLIEMRVMVRNDKEVVYYCPKCHEIAKISTEEEQKINKKKSRQLNTLWCFLYASKHVLGQNR